MSTPPSLVSTMVVEPVVMGQLNSAVYQGIPARGQVVQSGTFIAEVAVGRPAALAVVTPCQRHIHAAIDYPVELLAKRVAPD